MRITFRTAAAIDLGFQIAVLASSAGANGKTKQIKGRIVAYRPADRLLQLPSYAPNKEALLLASDGPDRSTRSTILKIN